MDGLTRITDQIADDTEREVADILLQAREDARKKHQHYQNAVEEMREKALAHGSLEVQEQIRRTTSAAELDARKNLLTVKQELISEVFEAALSQLSELPPDDYRSFLILLATKASLTGHEEIILNETDHQQHGTFIVDRVNQFLSNSGKTAAIRLSQETRTILGGLILKEGLVETNCTLEVLINVARNTMTSEVVKVLFEV